MTTELAPWETPTTPQAPEVGKLAKQSAELVAWAEGADSAFKVGKMLCQTDFAPDSYRGKPEATAAAILRGAEMGFDPLTSLSAFHVINKRVCLAAQTMLAVTQAAGHNVHIVESTTTRCVGVARRAGSDEQTKATWTIEQARDAGLVKQGSNWTKYPAQMLVARVTTDLCKRVAAAELMGLASIEEAQDGLADNTDAPATEDAAPAGTRKMSLPRKRRATKKAEPTPEPAGEPTTVDEAAQGATAEQIKKIDGLIKSKHIAPDAALTRARELVGREVPTLKHFTTDEAAQVIAALEEAPDAQS